MLLFRARRELLEAARWYKREDGLPLARDFGAKYRAQVLRARQLPQSGHLVSGLPPDIAFDLRRFLLDRFPHAVFVACLPQELVIVAVAHQHRRPRYWARRLGKVRT